LSRLLPRLSGSVTFAGLFSLVRFADLPPKIVACAILLTT